MLKKWFFSLINTVPLLVSANPLPPSVFPVISEVQWIDSLEWSVELKSYEILQYNVSLPCTTDSIKLYLFSSKTIYSSLLNFNSEGIAVLTRSSITGIPDNQKVIIKRNDKIFIPYIGVHENPPYTSIDEYANNGWICDIGNLKKSGNSLIGIGYQEFIESSRSSIGTKGNYTTFHHLFLIDRDGKPISGINIFNYKVTRELKFNYLLDNYLYSTEDMISDKDGHIKKPALVGQNFVAYLSDTSFKSLDLYASYGNLNDSIYPVWNFSYHDEIIEHYDTMIIAPNIYKVTIVSSNGTVFDSLSPKIGIIPVGTNTGRDEYLFRLFKKGGGYPIDFYRKTDSALVATCTLNYVDTRDTLTRTVTAFSTPIIRAPEKSISGTDSRTVFSALGKLSSGIRFVLATEYTLNHASIAVCLLDGRKVATVQIPSGAPGTHSVHWNPVDASGKKLSPGNYLCNLQIGKKTISSQKVSIF